MSTFLHAPANTFAQVCMNTQVCSLLSSNGNIVAYTGLRKALRNILWRVGFLRHSLVITYQLKEIGTLSGKIHFLLIAQCSAWFQSLWCLVADGKTR